MMLQKLLGSVTLLSQRTCRGSCYMPILMQRQRPAGNGERKLRATAAATEAATAAPTTAQRQLLALPRTAEEFREGYSTRIRT